jgi:hypothetical protein
MNTATILVLTGLFAISALGHFLPQFTRPDVFFGVTVDPVFGTSDAARRILRDYRIALWCSAIAAGASVWVLHRAWVAFLIYVIGACGAQVASHRRALIHATTRSSTIEVDLSAPKEHIPGGILVALLPFVALDTKWYREAPVAVPDAGVRSAHGRTIQSRRARGNGRHPGFFGAALSLHHPLRALVGLLSRHTAARGTPIQRATVCAKRPHHAVCGRTVSRRQLVRGVDGSGASCKGLQSAHRYHRCDDEP